MKQNPSTKALLLLLEVNALGPSRPGSDLLDPLANLRARLKEGLGVGTHQVVDDREVVEISQSEAITSEELGFGEPRLVDIQDPDELAFEILDSGRIGGHAKHAFEDTLECDLRGDRVKLLTFNLKPDLCGGLEFLAALAEKLLAFVAVLLRYVLCDGS